LWNIRRAWGDCGAHVFGTWFVRDRHDILHHL
jgi:hypothetical protein